VLLQFSATKGTRLQYLENAQVSRGAVPGKSGTSTPRNPFDLIFAPWRCKGSGYSSGLHL